MFYSFFESFPLVYPEIYHFNLGESCLPFLAIVVGLLICVPAYVAYYYYIVEPRVKVNGFGPPEDRLIPGLFCTFFVPIGMFIFGEFLFPICFAMLRGARRLVRPRVLPLDRHSIWSRRHNGRLLHHHPVALPLPTFHISSIRCLAFRCK